MRIFLLEDDYSLCQTIKESLELENYVVDTFYDGFEAMNNINTQVYTLYIVDVNVPSIDGLSILEYIIKLNNNAKVLIISASINLQTIKKAYNLGCLDYIKKPFFIDEIILKLKHIYDETKNCIKIDKNIYFSNSNLNLYIDDKLSALTKNERKFLYLLINNVNKVITFSQIEEFVYNGEGKSNNAIRSMVKRLRKKLPKNVIKNCLDEGYSITIDSYQ